MSALRNHPLVRFAAGSVRIWTHGTPVYFAWIALLLGLIALGIFGYVTQAREGLIATGLRDPVSWGFYIGNFTFLVGVAAAAVVHVIPP